MLRLAKSVFGGAVILAGLSSIPAEAAPQWCNTQRSLGPAERAICGSRQLSRLDSQLSISYKGARRSNPGARGAIKSSQRDWLGRRNSCGYDEACLVQRYEEQIDWLDRYGSHAGTPTSGGGDTITPWRSRGYRRCFDFVMSGRVHWGGSNQWRRQNAAWLCEAATDVSQDPPEPVYCFRQQRARGLDWQSAIGLCRENRGLMTGSAHQTEVNRRNNAPPQRTDGYSENGNYDPSEENDGYDEPQYNDDPSQGVDDSEDYANGNPFCGWWAIYTCHRSRGRAIRDMNNNGYGGVVDTNDVPNFRNGYYCVADGPFPRKRRARKLRNRARGDYQSAYIKRGC